MLGYIKVQQKTMCVGVGGKGFSHGTVSRVVSFLDAPLPINLRRKAPTRSSPSNLLPFPLDTCFKCLFGVLEI